MDQRPSAIGMSDCIAIYDVMNCWIIESLLLKLWNSEYFLCLKVSFFVFFYICEDAHGDILEGTVYLDKGKATFVPGKIDQNGAAYGTYNDSLFTTGWGILKIMAGFSKTPVTNVDMAFAAGYFEGVATSK